MASQLIVEEADLVVDTQDQETARQISKAYDGARQAAHDALRKVVICGLLMIEQKAKLKHGQFGPWLKSHCPHISWDTAGRWMTTANAVTGLLGMEDRTDLPLHRILALPAPELSEDAQEIQAKIFDLVDGKSQKQLLFDFKSTEERKYHPPKSDLAQRKAQKAHDTAEGVARQLIQLMGWVQTSGVLARVSNATRQEVEDARIELGHYLRDIKKPNRS